MPTEPFLLTEEYAADFRAAEECPARPDDLDAVKKGDLAVYGVDGEEVTVFLDEYARRFALDYCWI